jgi:hypothetical protein
MILDNHTLSNYRACFRKGWYRDQMKLEREGGMGAPALEFGIAWHGAMDELYKSKNVILAGEVFKATYNPFWDAYPDEFKKREKRTPDLGLSMLLNYWLHWEAQVMKYEVLAIEQYFKFPLSPDHSYCGLVDKVLLDTDTGLVVGMDHKTTSRLSSAYIGQMRISQQFRGYIYYLRHHSEFKDRMSNYFYADFALTTKTSSHGADNAPFYRETVLCDDDMLDEWHANTLTQIEMIQDRVDATAGDPEGFNSIPQNTDACSNYASLCQYYDICSAPVALRLNTIDHAYGEHTWNPADRVVEKPKELSDG